jgi:pyridoxal/pyridoxine/pyridoxamine kinase
MFNILRDSREQVNVHTAPLFCRSRPEAGGNGDAFSALLLTTIAIRNRCRFSLDIFLQTGKLLSSERSLPVMTHKLSKIVTEVQSEIVDDSRHDYPHICVTHLGRLQIRLSG